MIIHGSRIRNLKRHFGYLSPGTPVVFGVSGLSRFQAVLKQAGFTDALEEGEVILPAHFGAVSTFNAEGKEIVHKNLPMETHYCQVLWNYYEWHGPDRVRQSKIVERPYQKYPRTFIDPPSIELRIAVTPNGNKVVVSPVLEFKQNDALLHVVNLFLEIFGECQVLTRNLMQLIRVPYRRLNWQVLPPGKRSWQQLKREIQPVLKNLPQNNQQVAEWRFKILNQHDPHFVALGRGGFQGYVVFGFPTKNLYVLESLYTGNATYVFEEDWEELSKKTKAEILNQHLQKTRIIHRNGWSKLVKDLLSS